MRSIKVKRTNERRGERGDVSWIHSRLTYANVMSTIAIFGVLAGGGAYAVAKIGRKQIKKNARNPASGPGSRPGGLGTGIGFVPIEEADAAPVGHVVVRGHSFVKP